jgi:sodium/bile acid cotransporter 7
VNEGIWHQIPLRDLAGLVVACCVVLGLVLAASTVLGKAFGFNQEDRITILFCGSKKSLATGVPMAQVLFAGSTIGVLILPLMLFHQIQLMVCAVLAQRYANRQESVAELMGQVDP